MGFFITPIFLHVPKVKIFFYFLDKQLRDELKWGLAPINQNSMGEKRAKKKKIVTCHFEQVLLLPKFWFEWHEENWGPKMNDLKSWTMKIIAIILRASNNFYNYHYLAIKFRIPLKILQDRKKKKIDGQIFPTALSCLVMIENKK